MKGQAKLLVLIIIVATAFYILGNRGEDDAAEPVDIAALRSVAEAIPYDDLARYPDEYKGKPVIYTGKVVQVVSKTALRVSISQDQFGFWDDTVYVDLKEGAREVSLLEEDIIQLVGVANGDYTYTAVLGNRITVPRITAYEISLLAKRGEPWPPK